MNKETDEVLNRKYDKLYKKFLNGKFSDEVSL